MQTQPQIIWPENSTWSDNIRQDHVKLLYSALPTSIIINFLLALVLVAVQHNVIPFEQRFVWFALLLLVLLLRVVLLLAWRRASAGFQQDVSYWLQRFRFFAVVTGIVWGIGGALLSPFGNISHQVFVSFTLGGLCAGAITSLSIDRVSVLGFLVPILPPQIIFFLSQGNRISYGMGATIALFLCFISITAIKVGRNLAENHKLRFKAIESETRFRMMLDYSPVAASIIDRSMHQVVFANHSYADLVGLNLNDVIGTSPWKYYARRSEYVDALKQLDKGEKISNKLIELSLNDAENKSKWVLASYLPIDYQGKSMILRWLYDITDHKNLEEQVRYLAYHDPLTGLPNRSLLYDRLHQALLQVKRDQTLVAILFIDLDKFKLVNDTYGHDKGDLLLEEVSDRICACVRESDSVSRIGGDEFIVLLPDIKRAETALEIAEKIRLSLNQSFLLKDKELSISSSTGVAVYPTQANNEEQLINNADTAMYYAKSLGRNNVQLYRDDMNEAFQAISNKSIV